MSNTNMVSFSNLRSLPSKLFEVFDRATQMYFLVIKLNSDDSAVHWVLKQNGLGDPGAYQILLIDLCSGRAEMDAFKWVNSLGTRVRDLHLYLERHFDELESLSALDIEVILGEKDPLQAKSSRNPHRQA